MKKIYCVICGKYRKFKNPKIPYIFKKNIRSFYYLKCENKDKNYSQKKNQLRYQK